MRHKIGLILLLFFAFTLGFSGQIHASVGSGDFVVYRANISPMYIQNTSAPIQVMAIPFQNNKPVYATLAIHVQIKGMNVKYNYTQIINIQTGVTQTIYLPAMKQGHYFITTWATWKGIKSQVISEDFGVSPPPEPYIVGFTNDGSQIYFKSKVLNSTGQIDPNVTFRLEIYLWDGNQQSLVSVYNNVTNLTINVPPNWRTGILIVDVVDRYGWVNGMSINLENFQFSGYPVQYDYHQRQRYPLAGYDWGWYLTAVIGTIFAIVLGYEMIEKRRRRDMLEEYEYLEEERW